MKLKFAEAANRCQKEINSISIALASINGDLDAQMSSVQGLVNKMTILEGNELEAAKNCNQLCVEANIEDENDHTVLSVEDLCFDYNLVLQSLKKKLAFIENQVEF